MIYWLNRLTTAVLVRLFRLGPVAHAIQQSQRRPDIWGDAGRVHIHPAAQPEDALINVNSGHVTIGADSFFGQGVMLTTGRHDYTKRGAERHPHPAESGDIVIGAGVWIASRAIVCGPCTIGDHAVVAAGAVVTRDVPANTMVAGVPARTLRTLDHQ